MEPTLTFGQLAGLALIFAVLGLYLIILLRGWPNQKNKES